MTESAGQTVSCSSPASKRSISAGFFIKYSPATSAGQLTCWRVQFQLQWCDAERPPLVAEHSLRRGDGARIVDFCTTARNNDAFSSFSDEISTD
jgi:hypothetical protein